jgi:ABC-type lipoprotein release transport system permease subunit
MKRLTAHLKKFKKHTEIKNGKNISKIYNTISFKVKDDDEAIILVTHINENEHPKYNIKKWYTSNTL